LTPKGVVFSFSFYSHRCSPAPYAALHRFLTSDVHLLQRYKTAAHNAAPTPESITNAALPTCSVATRLPLCCLQCSAHAWMYHHDVLPTCFVAAAVVADTPTPSTLSSLLNANEDELPGIVQRLLEPLAFPFHLPSPLSPLPIKVDGSPQWHYSENALMKYHIKQAGRLPKGQVRATAGLLGQPATDVVCPTAPSLNHSRVSSWLYQNIIERQSSGTENIHPVALLLFASFFALCLAEVQLERQRTGSGVPNVLFCLICCWLLLGLWLERDAVLSVIHTHDCAQLSCTLRLVAEAWLLMAGVKTHYMTPAAFIFHLCTAATHMIAARRQACM